MGLSGKTIGWHAASMMAGAWGMAVFAQSGDVDLYSLLAQLKKTWGDLVILSGMLAPIVAAGGAAYRTWQQKQVPHDALVGPPNAVAIVPKDDAQPLGTGAQTEGVKGTVVAVGKTAVSVLLALLLVMPVALAQQRPLAILQPADILKRIVTDAEAALADARDHNDTIAANCYSAIIVVANAKQQAQAVTGGGAIVAFQKIRDIIRLDATPQGTSLISGCAALVQDAKLNMLEFFAKIGGTVLIKGLLIP